MINSPRLFYPSCIHVLNCLYVYMHAHSCRKLWKQVECVIALRRLTINDKGVNGLTSSTKLCPCLLDFFDPHLIVSIHKFHTKHWSQVDSPHKGSVLRSDDAFFDVSPNKLLNSQTRCSWMELSWQKSCCFAQLSSDEAYQMVHYYTCRFPGAI